MKRATNKSHFLRIRSHHVVGSFMALVGILWLIPIFYLVINAFKPLRDVVMRTAQMPTSLYLDNFAAVWKNMNYPQLLLNSLFVTAGSVALTVVLCSMAGYKLARMSGKFANLLLLYFLLAMVIPFQALMVPLVKLMSDLKLSDSLLGLIILYVAIEAPIAIYLYYGAAKAIPTSLEESARIDGAGPLRTFYSVIFPLLRPMTGTVVILTSLWIWNDFLIPLILLSDPAKKTLPLGTTAMFFGTYMNKWNLGITAILMASLPMLLLFFVMQKHIVKGITAGSVKG